MLCSSTQLSKDTSIPTEIVNIKGQRAIRILFYQNYVVTFTQFLQNLFGQFNPGSTYASKNSGCSRTAVKYVPGNQRLYYALAVRIVIQNKFV